MKLTDTKNYTRPHGGEKYTQDPFRKASAIFDSNVEVTYRSYTATDVGKR
jgi:hypothetical protein